MLVSIYVPEKKQIVQITEGSKELLTSEDTACGYVDFIKYEQIVLNGGFVINEGKLLLKEPFRDKYECTADCIPIVLRRVYDNPVPFQVLDRADKVIGTLKVDEDGEVMELNREYFRQGCVYKNPVAYREDKTLPCYVPELSDHVYTGEDFLELCNNQEDFADELFEGVDWQHPETLVEDWMRNDEWALCECGFFVNYGDGCNDKKCPNCGKEIADE